MSVDENRHESRTAAIVVTVKMSAAISGFKGKKCAPSIVCPVPDVIIKGRRVALQ